MPVITDRSWDDDDAPAPKDETVMEYPGALKDTSIMQWGKDHKGKMLKQVPGKYLIWYYENVKFIDARLKQYIEDNYDSLKQEAGIGK